MLLKFVARNLRKRPFLNFVKVFGLALALTGIVFITIFLKGELSYDSFHCKSERIYRFTVTDPNLFDGKHFARTYYSGYIPDLKATFPEIEEYVRLAPIRGGIIKNSDIIHGVSQAFECDSTFFKVFDADLLLGDKNTALQNPGSVILSESFAHKVFGDENPIEKIVIIPAGQFHAEDLKFTVKGVMKDFPANSHFHPELIVSAANEKFNGWAWNYFVLAENANLNNIISSYKNFIAQLWNLDLEEVKMTPHLQKLTDIHLHSNKLREIEDNGTLSNIYVLSIAAVILLIISLANFASLNIGMLGFARKFLSINRVVGASGNIRVKYYLLENSIVSLLALFICALISIPVNQVILRNFNLNLLQGKLILIIVIAILYGALAMLAGILPVIKLNIFNIASNKSTQNCTQPGISSKFLLVSQYAFSIILIIAVIAISRQTNFALGKSMGAKNDNVICLELVHQSVQKKFEIFKEELLKYNSIETVSAMQEQPGGEANDSFFFEMEGYEAKGDNIEGDAIVVFACDYSFVKLFNLELLSGNNFSPEYVDNDGSGEYIINESAMNQLGYSNPKEIVGKGFKLIFNMEDIVIPRGQIVGVVKDFHLSSIKKKIEPLVLFKRNKMWISNFVMSHKAGMQKQALQDIKKVWSSLFPEYPFNYEFVGSMYRNVYKTEMLQAGLLSIFTFISLFICGLGLLGLSLLTAQARTKEIGIRKVNGAKVYEILNMLNKEFVIMVLVAFVIACPVGYYAMDMWLENFAYKTTLSWWIFALAGVLALGIALLTVSWQSWRAASRNPVKSLRYE